MYPFWFKVRTQNLWESEIAIMALKKVSLTVNQWGLATMHIYLDSYWLYRVSNYPSSTILGHRANFKLYCTLKGTSHNSCVHESYPWLQSSHVANCWGNRYHCNISWWPFTPQEENITLVLSVGHTYFTGKQISLWHRGAFLILVRCAWKSFSF